MLDGVGPNGAQAQGQCYGAGFTDIELQVCVEAQAGVDGTTVAPSVYVTCVRRGALIDLSRDPCSGNLEIQIGEGDGYGISLDRTGFEPNPQFPLPCVDADAGTVRSQGGTLGTLYANGTAYPLSIGAFYLGNPAGCL